MQQFGTASVWGVDGTAAYDGGSAIAGFIESAEGEHDAQFDEFKSGLGEMLGWRKCNEVEAYDITIVPKATAATGSLNDALKALKYPPSPCKVTIAGMGDTDTAGGHSANEIGHNGDYIYLRGARRTIVRGQAAIRMRILRYKTSPLTVAQLLTPAT